MNPSQIERYVLMRFNLNLSGYRHIDNNDLTWLSYRLRLAELTAFHSLSQQSMKDFKLVIMLNTETPDSFTHRLSQAVTDMDASCVKFEDGSTAQQLRKYLLSNVDTTARAIQTTRIDSDDMVHHDFMAKIAAYCDEFKILDQIAAGPRYISFPTGQDYTTGSDSYNGIYYPQNAFGTLIEPVGPGLKTVLSFKHNEISKQFKTTYLARDQAMWCRILHGSNLLNKAKGLRRVKGRFSVHPDLGEFGKTPPIHPPQKYEPQPFVRSRFKRLIDRLRKIIQ